MASSIRTLLSFPHVRFKRTTMCPRVCAFSLIRAKVVGRTIHPLLSSSPPNRSRLGPNTVPWHDPFESSISHKARRTTEVRDCVRPPCILRTALAHTVSYGLAICNGKRQCFGGSLHCSVPPYKRDHYIFACPHWHHPPSPRNYYRHVRQPPSRHCTTLHQGQPSRVPPTYLGV